MGEKIGSQGTKSPQELEQANERTAAAAAETVADTDPPAPVQAPPAEDDKPEKKDPPKVGVIPGREHLSDIYASARAVRAQEVADGEPAPEPEDTDAADGDDTDAGDAAPPAAPAAAAPAAPAVQPAPASSAPAASPPVAPAAPGPKVVEYDPTAIYQIRNPATGQMMAVPGATLIGLAQRGYAAARQAPNAAPATPAADTTEKPPTPKADIDYGGIVRAIQVGTDEEAAKALKQIVDTAREGASAAPDEVARKAAEIAYATFQTDRALEDFKRDYSAVANDPSLMPLVAQHVHAIRSIAQMTGQAKDQGTLLREAGDAVIAWAQSKGMQIARTAPAAAAPAAPSAPAPAPQPAAPQVSLAARREAKRSAPQLVQPATARTPTAAPPTKSREEKNSDYVASMQRQRMGVAPGGRAA